MVRFHGLPEGNSGCAPFHLRWSAVWSESLQCRLYCSSDCCVLNVAHDSLKHRGRLLGASAPSLQIHTISASHKCPTLGFKSGSSGVLTMSVISGYADSTSTPLLVETYSTSSLSVALLISLLFRSVTESRKSKMTQHCWSFWENSSCCSVEGASGRTQIKPLKWNTSFHTFYVDMTWMILMR